MGIRFIFGPAGSGKSTYVRNLLIRESREERDRNFFLIVPDQYTMQTQFEMATAHPNGGILNIDVLSFGRLKHSVFEEVGRDGRIPLDDTGKCLILRKIMGEQKEQLTVLRKSIQNSGCVEEIKSIICEFMQYGIQPEELADFLEQTGENRSLYHKLTDIKLLYGEFQRECREKYLTSEESLNLLCDRIPLSGRLKDSLIAFDGFTGFTPIQINVILALAHQGREVLITLPFDERYEAFREDGEEFFLHLTQKTVKAIQKRSEAENIPILPEVMLSNEKVYRFQNNPELRHLEHNLFRKGCTQYAGSAERIEIVKAGTVEQECRLACEWMFQQIKEQGLRYRDIAIITGDMNTYREPLKKFFLRYDVPYFMDSTVNMLKNPFIQFLRSTLNIMIYDFSYRDCMAFIRSGYADFTMEEADILDNYLRAKGIKGRGAYGKPFYKPSRLLKNKPEELERINAVRERLVHMFDRFGQIKANTEKPAIEWVEAFYYFLTDLKLQEKLEAKEAAFREEGDLARAKEFGQLYRYVIELFDQVAGLICEEPLTLRAFAEILEAGYGEIRIGILPQGVDVLVVGDMERTRLNEVKTLLFLGVNDGNIPKASKKGGILSDLEKEIMRRTGRELSPSPTQQIFIQRLYLYLAVTKPAEGLYLSYASVSEDGSKKAPSYFIKSMTELFPKLVIKNRERDIPLLSVKDEQEQFTRLLTLYASGAAAGEENFRKLQDYYGDLLFRGKSGEWAEEMIGHAFRQYVPENLREELAEELYGEQLKCSVSSLENFAACQYAHFLAYGLHLSEREEASFERRDFGSLNHEFLEAVGKAFLTEGRYLNDITEEELESKINQALEDLKQEDTWDIFGNGARSEFLTEQLRRLMKRSFHTISQQLARGKFHPEYFEIPFGTDLPGEKGNSKIWLNGRIDRIDLCEAENKLYVKIIDYKTGGKEFNEALFEMGLQIQIAVYLKQALSIVKQKKPDMEIVPAAMLYYHVQDPFIESEDNTEDTDLEKDRLEKLNHSGIVSNDPFIIDLMDQALSGKSKVIPATVSRNGSIGPSSAVTSEYLEAMLQFSEEMVRKLSDGIYRGEMAVNPIYEENKYNSCSYCAFKETCPFDEKIKGFRRRRLEQPKGMLLTETEKGEETPLRENNEEGGTV